MTWIARWSQKCTFLSCSYYGKQYKDYLEKELGKGIGRTLAIHRRGDVTFFMGKESLDAFGQFLAQRIMDSEQWAMSMLDEAKRNYGLLVQCMENGKGKMLSREDYAIFMYFFERHITYHCFIKKAVDYLPPEFLERLFPHFEDARKYTEDVYKRTEVFFTALCHAIAEQEHGQAELLQALTNEELENYLQKGELPDDNILRERHEASALLFADDALSILTGRDAEKIENETRIPADTLSGTTAYPGKVQGICRRVTSPSDFFEEGNILVTGMTSPDFLPLIAKAGAVITDAGGMLSHAAIVCRELKKPCIVGTGQATTVLHDGMMIEVDADTGRVNIL